MVITYLSNNMKKLFLLLISVFTIVNAVGAEYYRVNADILNVRNQPSTDGQIVGSIKSGDIVKGNTNESGGEWIYVESDHVAGYASSQYLQFSHSDGDAEDKSVKKDASKIFDIFESFSVPNIGEGLMTFIIVLLLIVQIVLVKFEFNPFTHIAVALLAIVSVAELYYLCMENVDVTWFFERHRVGWFGCIIGFLGFGFFLYGQLIAILETLNSINVTSGVYINWLWGLASWGVGAIVLLILSIFSVDVDFFWMIFILYQLGFCIYVLIVNIMEKRIVRGILLPAFYLLIMIPFSFLVLTFLTMVIFVAIVLFVIGAICGGAASSGKSSSDVTLTDGTELRETGVNTYEDSYGHRWNRNGDRFSRED